MRGKSIRLVVVVTLLLTVAGTGVVFAQGVPEGPANRQFTITKIFFEGNHRIPHDTLFAHIFSRPRDPYDMEALQRDLRSLWKTHSFENIRLEVQNDPDKTNGKIVIFRVQEQPFTKERSSPR